MIHLSVVNCSFFRLIRTFFTRLKKETTKVLILCLRNYYSSFFVKLGQKFGAMTLPGTRAIGVCSLISVRRLSAHLRRLAANCSAVAADGNKLIGSKIDPVPRATRRQSLLVPCRAVGRIGCSGGVFCNSNKRSIAKSDAAPVCTRRHHHLVESNGAGGESCRRSRRDKCRISCANRNKIRPAECNPSD